MSRPLIPAAHLDAAPEPGRALRFMEVVRRRLREARYSPRTCEAYIHWIRRFVRYHGRRHPKDLGEDDGLVFHDGRHVDLDAGVREAALLARPMAPLCRPDCRGLCPRCGADWNEGPCPHVPATGTA